MTKRQIFLPGGGGGGGPTFIINDSSGVKDDPTWAWELGDRVGAEDDQVWGIPEADHVGTSDSMDWFIDPLNDLVGVKDAMDWLISPFDDRIGVQESQAWAMPMADFVGAEDSAVITGQGTPQWQSVGLFEGSSSSGSTVTIPKPVGTVEGDLLVAHVAIIQIASGLPVTPPTGWTLIRSGSTGVNVLSAATFWKIAGDSEPADYIFDFSGAGGSVPRIGEIHRFSGIDPTTPINVSASGVATTADPTNPSVTTTVANCLVVAFLAHDHLNVPQTHTPAAGHTEHSDYDGANTGNILVGGHMQSRVFAAAGATGTVVHNCTVILAASSVMQRIAIAPGPINVVL